MSKVYGEGQRLNNIPCFARTSRSGGGEIKPEKFSEKDKQWLKVWLKEHGIEPYDW